MTTHPILQASTSIWKLGWYFLRKSDDIEILWNGERLFIGWRLKYLLALKVFFQCYWLLYRRTTKTSQKSFESYYIKRKTKRDSFHLAICSHTTLPKCMLPEVFPFVNGGMGRLVVSSFMLAYGWEDREWVSYFFYFSCLCAVVNCSFMADVFCVCLIVPFFFAFFASGPFN